PPPLAAMPDTAVLSRFRPKNPRRPGAEFSRDPPFAPPPHHPRPPHLPVDKQSMSPCADGHEIGLYRSPVEEAFDRRGAAIAERLTDLPRHVDARQDAEFVDAGGKFLHNGLGRWRKSTRMPKLTKLSAWLFRILFDFRLDQ